MQKYILTIDQGTTNTKATLYNNKFIPIHSEQIEIKQFFPHEGWVEHDPEEIWKSVLYTIKNVIKKNKIKPNDVSSIGITNQRETSLIWNRDNGEPIYNAIVWQDRRTAKYCEKIKTKKLEKLVQKITGLTIDSYFSATKIKWILDNIKNSKFLLKKNKLLFGNVDSWILWKLTNGESHFTDVTNASRTLLYDIVKKNWSSEMLKLFKIPKKILPKVKPNIYNFGTTKILGNKIKINGIIGDQQAALIGQACFKKGMSKSTYGTGCFLLMNIGNKPCYSKNKLLTSIAYEINGKTSYCLEGSIFVAGSAIQWLRDGIKIIKSANETDYLYKKADSEQNIYVVPAFTGMGAPYWQQNVRGAIFGINRNTQIPEIVKATIQSICFQTKDLINLMQKDSLTKITEIRVDGGMVNNQSFMEFLSGILDIKIIKPKYSETTALGAAYLSAIGSGLINIKTIKEKWKKEKIYNKKLNEKKRKELYQGWLYSVKKNAGQIIDYRYRCLCKVLRNHAVLI